MRFDGTLKSWNAERGFGFITPRTGGQDIFVHVSAFPRDGRAPREGEILSFEVETTAEGKKRALRVQRPGSTTAAAAPPAARGPRRHRRDRQGIGFGSAMITLAILVALGWYAYGAYEKAVARHTQPLQTVPTAVPDAPLVGNFRCDGRMHCSQMSSCAEATYFLRNCPGVQMDGDNDGVPCEQQWCTGGFAR